MPPRRETVRELLMYEYAKLIADSAIAVRMGLTPAKRTGAAYWSFVMATYRRLNSGAIAPSDILRENKVLMEIGDSCAYCGCSGQLQWEHIVPRSLGGPDNIDNLVRACASCNSAKRAHDPISWFGERRAQIPRLVMGKLLKLLLEAHGAAGTLDAREYPLGRGLKTVQLVEVFQCTSQRGMADRKSPNKKMETDG
jgi:hypothetical protein